MYKEYIVIKRVIKTFDLILTHDSSSKHNQCVMYAFMCVEDEYEVV